MQNTVLLTLMNSKSTPGPTNLTIATSYTVESANKHQHLTYKINIYPLMSK